MLKKIIIACVMVLSSMSMAGGSLSSSFPASEEDDEELFRAASDGDYSRVKALLEEGYSANAFDSKGVSLLFYAFGVKCPAGKVLPGCDYELVQTFFKDDRSLLEAERFEYPEMVRLLVQAGAKVDVVSRRYFGSPKTILTYALVGRYFGVARVLVDLGANKNLWQSDGTPLMWVAGQGNIEAVNFLLECGVEIDFAGPEGLTALGIAMIHGKTHIVDRLLGRDADARICLGAYSLDNYWASRGCADRLSADQKAEIRGLIAEHERLSGLRRMWITKCVCLALPEKEV